jgi:hypothetical protein
MDVSLMVSHYIRLIPQYQQLTLDIAKVTFPGPLVFVAKPASDTDSTVYVTDYSNGNPMRWYLNLQVILANLILQLNSVMALRLPTTKSSCNRISRAHLLLAVLEHW